MFLPHYLDFCSVIGSEDLTPTARRGRENVLLAVPIKNDRNSGKSFANANSGNKEELSARPQENAYSRPVVLFARTRHAAREPIDTGFISLASLFFAVITFPVELETRAPIWRLRKLKESGWFSSRKLGEI